MKGEKSNRVLLSYAIHHLSKVEGHTRLQNVVYLLKNIYNVGFTYDFRNSMFGPYSVELASDVNALRCLGLVKENKVFTNDGIKYTYETTDECEKMLTKYPEPSGMKEALERLNKLGTERLVALTKMLMVAQMHNIQIDVNPTALL